MSTLHFSDADRQYMHRALELARKGLSWTYPHPLVGAVIVKDGQILAEGYHHTFGDEHAEADAILTTQADLRGAKLYVTLEPCHLPYDLHGTRIPCCEYVIKAGITQVHIAMLDSNPEVAGDGRKVLEAAGVETTLGCLGEEALAVNAAYHHFMTQHQSLVVLSEVNENGFTQRELKNTHAVLVTAETLLNQQPDISCHDVAYQDPVLVFLDPDLQVSLTAPIFENPRVIVITKSANVSTEQMAAFKAKHISVITYIEENLSLNGLLALLAKVKIVSLLINKFDHQTLSA